MKIAILGETLHAHVLATLFAEYGNDVFWCKEKIQQSTEMQLFVDNTQDLDISQRLGNLYASLYLNNCTLLDLPLDIEVYFFCYNPAGLDSACTALKALSQKPIIHPKLMVNASTFGLHGTEKLKQILPHDDWVYFPDVSQEGNAINSILSVKQVVVGAESTESKCKVLEIFRPFFPHERQFLFMPILDAEFTKLSISGMLATRISYMNDLASVAEKLGIDIANVQQGMGSDSRIGSAYLSAGAGFGGENFSHDILTLSSELFKNRTRSRLLQQVWDINEQQKELLFRKLWRYYHSNLEGKIVAIWGAAFKENTSSIHNSPIHAMLNALWAQGVIVQLHDPQALIEIEKYYGSREDLILMHNPYDAVKNADALCILTAWRQYFSPDYKRLQQEMNHPLILDGRNIYNPQYVKNQGFAYEGVGRS